MNTSAIVGAENRHNQIVRPANDSAPRPIYCEHVVAWLAWNLRVRLGVRRSDGAAGLLVIVN